jgi:hypothetical protein
MSRTRLTGAFWAEALLSGFSASLALLTLLWRDWIEIVLGFDPDHGNGSAEWIAVMVLVGISIGTGALARGRWLRARAVAVQ